MDTCCMAINLYWKLNFKYPIFDLLCTILTKRELFLLGGVQVENARKNPCPDWLPINAWDEICRVQEMSAFTNIATQFAVNQTYWKVIYDHFIEDFKMPSPWQQELSAFERLIITRILRSDKLLSSVKNFVKNEMDERFIRPPPFSISASYDESYCLCPLIFILSPGTDPMSTLVKYAESKKMSEKFKSISLGQGKFFYKKNVLIYICLGTYLLYI